MNTNPFHLAVVSALCGAGTLQAQTTVLSEGFEGAFPGAWSVGDNNPSGTAAYWQDVNAAFGGEATHTGNWKGYCAGHGFVGDAANPSYQNDMTAYLSRTIDLRGYDDASLTFWYKTPSIESCCDKTRVVVSSIDSTEVWSSSAPVTDWTRVVIDLGAYVGTSPTLTFEFDSDPSVTAEGWYLDDILVTGFVRPVNDDCDGAVALQNGAPYTMNTLGATDDSRVPSCRPNSGKGVWFRITPALSGAVEVSTCGSDFDTALQVYAGPLCRTMTEVSGGCNDDDGPLCAGRQASVRFPVTANMPYQILAGGYDGAGGTLRILARFVDTEPPQITCPANLVLDTDPGQCAKGNVTFSPTATDNVGVTSLVCTPPSGSTFAKGVTTVRCVVADAAGNTNSCSFTVTVRDIEPPQMSCPGDFTVACGAPWNFGTPTATDNCDGANVNVQIVSTVTNVNCGLTFTATRTWRAADSANNVSTCQRTVTVMDTAPPTLVCPPDRTVPYGAPWTFGTPTVSDACAGGQVQLEVVATITNGLPSCSHTITRIWRATDPCGNEAHCGQVVAVVKEDAPAIVCVSNRMVECGTPWAFTPPTVNAPEGRTFAANFDAGLPPGTAVHGSAFVGFSSGDIQTTNGILKLTEAVNSQLGSFIIEDFNEGQPVSQFTARFRVRLGGSTCCEQNGQPKPADGFSFNFAPDLPDSPFSEDGEGSGLRVTFDLWDNGVGDSGPAIAIVNNGVELAARSMGEPREDSRPPATSIPTDPATGAPMLLSTGDSWTDVLVHMDADGTVDVSYKGVEVLSNVATGYVPSAGRFGFGARTGGANSTHYIDDLLISLSDCLDNCVTVQVLNTVTNVLNGKCPKLWAATRTWRVTDVCGHSTDCSQTVTVADRTPPVLAGCPSDKSYQCLRAVPSPAVVTAVDRCDGAVPVSFVETQSHPGSSAGNVIVRTWTARDACGNAATCSQTIRVNDTTPPSLVCSPDIAVETKGADARIDFVVTATDNCDPSPAVTCVPASGSVFPLGTNLVHCVASDVNGNTSQCDFTVTVTRRTHAPTLTAQPQSVTVPAGDPVRFEVVAEGTPPLAYQWFFNGYIMPDATNRAQVIDRTLPSHGGAYAVRVSNAFGSVTSPSAVLTLQATHKVDGWKADAIAVALSDSVYARLEAAVAARGFQTEPWKAQVQWGYDNRPKDPEPVCVAVTVPCRSPEGSDARALVGVLRSAAASEEFDSPVPQSTYGGVALMANPQGEQRTTLRILCDTNGVCSAVELLDDPCLADWFHPPGTGTNGPTYTEIIADLIQSCAECASAGGSGQSCARCGVSMGIYTFCVLGICLPPEFPAPPMPFTLSEARRVQAAGAGAGTVTPLDGTQTCCGDVFLKNGVIGAVAGAGAGFKAGGPIGGLVGAGVGAGVGLLFGLDDDEAEWCIARAEPYAVLEGTVGRITEGGLVHGFPSHFSSTDRASSHDSLDWIIKVAPFDANEAWPGSPDYSTLASQFNDIDQGKRMMECEWESQFVPNFIRTWPGDRIWMRGQLIFDCGHSVEIGGSEGHRSEIHPLHALVTMRLEGAPLSDNGIVMPARVARVYITPWGGEANHPDDININGKVWWRGTRNVPAFDAEHTPYQFKVPLPPQPIRCDLTPGINPGVFVRIEPAPSLARAVTTISEGGGLRVTRQKTLAHRLYTQRVLDGIEVSLWPDAVERSHLLVKVPLDDGPIPDLGGGISPLQFKIAVGWSDAPLALQVNAAMPVWDDLGKFEIPAGESPLAISPGQPLANGRSWVPPDRRTLLRVTGPDCAWRVTPLQVDFMKVHVNFTTHAPIPAHFRLVAGADGEWRSLTSVDGVNPGRNYPVNVSVPVWLWDPIGRDLEVSVLGIEKVGWTWPWEHDIELGRIFRPASLVSSPYLDVLSSDRDYSMDYRIRDQESVCIPDSLDPGDDEPETATGIVAPGSRSFAGMRLGPKDTADWFALDTDDYMTFSATLDDQTTPSADRCRNYSLRVSAERAVLPPDRFDDGVISNTACAFGGGALQIQEVAGRNEDWASSPILQLCPSAFSQTNFDCNINPLQDLNPDGLAVENLNFHAPNPGLDPDPDPDRDFYRIQVPLDLAEQCAAPCPNLLKGEFHPTALTILIEADRDRPMLVTVTNFVSGFTLDNDPATPIPDKFISSGHTLEIKRRGTRTVVQLECPRGSTLFPDGLVGLSLSDPEGQRNFYDLFATYNVEAVCIPQKLLVNPGLAELILGRIWGYVDPIRVRLLPILGYADATGAGLALGKTMPFLDGPDSGGVWSADDRWLVLLPRGQTTMNIEVTPPPNTQDYEVGIELRDLDDQPIAQATEITGPLNNPLAGGGGGARLSAASPAGAGAAKHFRLETGQMDGCFKFLRVTRPQVGGTFTVNVRLTQSPEIGIAPAALSFGNRCQGTLSDPRWVAVNNSGTAGLMVSDLSLSGPDAAEFVLLNTPGLPAEIAPGGQLSFAVGFQPTHSGASQAEVIMASNDPSHPVWRLPVDGIGQASDQQPPRLTCPSTQIVWACTNGATVHYTVSASDDCDTLLETVCTPPSGSRFGLGTNWVHCSVTDQAGRSAECSFAVVVLSDREPPELVCPTNRVVDCMGPDGAAVFYRFEASDNSGGPVTVTCTPPSGSWFPLGETLVTCEAVDACGNWAQCTFPVVVQDAPVPLAIAFENGKVRLTWPAACANYTLQTATTLAMPIQWAAAAETPVAAGDGYTVTLQATNATRFIRLRRNE